MAKQFDVSARYSKALDQLRGPERRKDFLERGRAWTLQSSSRRSVARLLGAGVLFGVIGLVAAREKGALLRVGSGLKNRVSDRLAS